MSKEIIHCDFDPDEIIEYISGKARYKGHLYSRKRSAYNRRAKDICDHTKREWEDLVCKHNSICCRCGCHVIGSPTKDHIIPTVLGGSSSIKNLQPLCRQCNLYKGQNIRDYR